MNASPSGKTKSIPEGSEKRVISILKNIGLISVLISGSYILIQLAKVPYVVQSLSWTYVSLFVIPVGTLLFLYGTYKPNLFKRRRVDAAELKSLFSYVEKFKDEKNDAYKRASSEVERLNSSIKHDYKIFELDLLTLRQTLVELYAENELASQAKYELNLFREYAEDDDPRLFEKKKEKINKLVNGIEKDGAKSKNILPLRAELISLRESVAQYEKSWAEGETIFKRVLYWDTVTAMVMLGIGLLPLLHSLGAGIIEIGHWWSLGVTGGLLSILVRIQDPSIPELGETKGKQVLYSTLSGIVIGGIASVLLYAALSSEILGGKIFPKIPFTFEDTKYGLYTGASIFWGIMAGFSLRIFVGLVGIAEAPFRKDE